jgi:phosphomannomutase
MRDPALFENGEDGRIAVRASATEPGTRLYIETTPGSIAHLTAGLNQTA